MASQEAVDHVNDIVEQAKAADAAQAPGDAEVNGLPWWFGPDYHPTDQAIAAFAEMPDSAKGGDSDEQPGIFD